MKSLDVLVFDLSGEYGHFRKYNTTSSPLTYIIPTRLAIVGILGAVLGIEREIGTNRYRKGTTPLNELFDRSTTHLAIQVLNPVKKVNIGFNLLDTGKSASSFFNIQNRTQIEFELLKNPKFRIYFSHQDKGIFQELAERIASVNHHFTPYLGLSQFTAKLEWIGKENLQQNAATSFEPIEIVTAVNLSTIASGEQVIFDKNAYYTSDTHPLAMRRDRTITEYGEILLERDGQPIQLKSVDYWQSSLGKIRFI